MKDATDYEAFLATKVPAAPERGFKPVKLPSYLWDWQAQIVGWACRLGRAAIFAGCGCGKTAMQLAWSDLVREQSGGRVLILCPLAVGPQTALEAEKFGIGNVKVRAGSTGAKPGEIVIANYQKVLSGAIVPSHFDAVVLDESSILKNYTGKTKQALLDAFSNHRFRLCCTATPAPNDYLELGNHAEFLGVMPSNEMIARWFIAEQGEGAGHYRLKGHAESDFWRWVATWAITVDKPSDLGYPDGDRVLPPLHVHKHIVDSDPTEGAGEDDGQRLMFRVPKLTATSLHGELRRSVTSRAEKAADLVKATPGAWVIWCNTDYEQDEIMALLPPGETVEVRGKQSDKVKENNLAAFASGKVRILVSKPSMCGFGLNWQHCGNVAFVGLSYSHEQYYQALRRCWRFGRAKDVNCHIILGDGEHALLSAVERKERDALRMRAAMIKASHEAHGRHEVRELSRVAHKVATGKNWELHLGDCVEVAKDLPADSVDLCVFSPPFAGLYIYSPHLQDMGNCKDDAEFEAHLGFLAPELLRITRPGRMCCVHCKDLPKYANRDGITGLKDFPGRLISLFEASGWSYHSRVTVWKCPVIERERTNNNGLLYKTLRRDSSQVRQGMADYLIVFRKPPLAENGLMASQPIVRPEGLVRYVGDEQWAPRAGESNHPSPYSRRASADPALAVWQRYADPVWFDIDQTDTLNEQAARDGGDEKHICPLQLGLIRRCVDLWSLPGETVFSPFAGIGSEGYVSLQEGRRFVGIELKESYHRRACHNLAVANQQGNLPGIA